MPADFPSFEAEELPRQPVRQPIDYRSRNTKLRLFAAVAMLILVLALAERARDPASWNWLFGLKSKSGEVEKPINDRVARTEAKSEEPETVFINPEKAKVLPKEVAPEATGGRESWLAAWRAVWRDLGADERTLLFRLMESAEDGKPFETGSAARAQQAIQGIDERWASHQSAAYQEVSALKDDEAKKWTGALGEANARWKATRKVLELVAQGGTAAESESAVLAGLQRDLETISLASVRDDSPFLRPDENQIWFHLFHKLQGKSPRELRPQGEGVVGYSTIQNQPETYRGKLVSIRAQVRWAYRVAAIKNYLGIKEFTVLYLAAEGAPDKVFVVYSLNVPPRFPEINSENHPSGKTEMHEDVVVTGYFLKRGAWRGSDANYTGPLLLANSFEWKPSPGQKATFARGASIWREAIVVSAVMFTAGAIAVYLLFGRGSKPRKRFDGDEVRAEVAALEKADLPPTLRESLKKLAEETRDEKS